MQCVILAGGLGTRIRAAAGDLPKSLIPIAGKPFIAYQLQQLRQSGVQRVVLCIGYQGDHIRAVVGNGSHWGLEVHYVDEGTQLQGTGGALRLAGDQGMLDPLFFMLYGDSFLPIDFLPILVYFNSRIEAALMTVMRNQGQWDQCNVCFDGSKVTRYDKEKAGTAGMEYIDYGLSLRWRDPMLGHIPAERPYDLAAYFKALSASGDLAGDNVQQRFYEIGSMAGLQDFKYYVDKGGHA